MASPAPWYCRYGIHGDIAKQVNIDGTAIYRVRERPCDCTPPQPPRRPRPASATAPLAWQPQPPQRQRRMPGRGRRVVSVGTITHSLPRAPLTSSTNARGVYPLPPPPSMPPSYAVPPPRPNPPVDARLRVVVPPLSLDSAVGDAYAGYVAAAGIPNGSDVGSAVPLPTIPVIPPLGAAPAGGPYGIGGGGSGGAGVEAGSVVSVPLPAPAVGLPPVLPIPPLPPPPPAAAALSAVEPLGAGLPPVHPPAVPPLPVPSVPTAAAAPAPAACTGESHAVDRLCGFVYCPTCGARVASDNLSSAASFTPAACPQGPHGTGGTGEGSGDGARPPAAQRVGRFCFLCGADSLQGPALVEAGTATTETTAATAPSLPPSQAAAATAAAVTAGEGPVPVPVSASSSTPPAGEPQPAVPPHDASAPAAPPTAAALTCDVAQDLYTVEQIMEHLLRSATANGGRVRPPCGLPHCRLCTPFASRMAPPPPPLLPLTATCACAAPTRWGASAPVMCGSPAIAIIHNHYAR